MPSQNILSAILKQVKPAAIIFVLLTIITGIIYPFLVTGIAQIAFPWQSHGSLIYSDGEIIGSDRIGQQFSSDEYFWGRPSATSPAYNSGLSTGSNIGPTNPGLRERVIASVDALHKASPESGTLIPVDLVTTSASGLDPDISIASAYYQVSRVAQERNLSEDEVTTLVNQQIQRSLIGIIGESRINVLRLNQALDLYHISHRNVVPSVSSSIKLDFDGTTTIFGIRETDLFQWALFFLVLFALVVPLGRFMAGMYQGQQTLLSKITTPLEEGIFRICGISAEEEMDWKTFAVSLLIFNFLGILVVFFLQVVEQYLPLIGICFWTEQMGNPLFSELGIDQIPSAQKFYCDL